MATMGYATCRTEGCHNEGIAIPVEVVNDDGVEIGGAHCGACGQPIPEVTADVPGDAETLEQYLARTEPKDGEA